MQPKHWLDPVLALNASSIHDGMGSSLQQLRGRKEIKLQPKVAPLGGRGRLPLCRYPKPPLAFSKPRFMWRNYSRTLNNPRAIEDRPAEMQVSSQQLAFWSPLVRRITVLIASALINASTIP